MSVAHRTGSGRTGIWARLRGLFARSASDRVDADDPMFQPYRLLARQLLADFPSDGRGRVVFVPSVAQMPTDTLLTIAYFLRDELGSRVLLADASGRPAGLGERLGIHGLPGLLDLVHDTARKLSDLVRPTARPGIMAISFGHSPANGQGAVAASRIETVLEETRRTFDYTLVQLPPITEDPAFLRFVTLCDTVMLIVAEGTNDIEDLARARSVLEGQGAPDVRMVLCGSH